jgi:hypothetical protein
MENGRIADQAELAALRGARNSQVDKREVIGMRLHFLLVAALAAWLALQPAPAAKPDPGQ